jgi:hypothetical protein
MSGSLERKLFGPLRLRATSPEVMSLHRPENAQHVAQFYERDELVIANVGYLARETLAQGDSVVLIGTPSHLNAMQKLNRLEGLDLNGLRKNGRYLALDAAETLSAVLGNRSPDKAKFETIVGRAISGAIDRSANGFVFTFGEIVALLCSANRCAAAVELERLWNALTAQYRFSLYCAYPLSAFGNERDIDTLLTICAEHALAIPAEHPL